jgi:hypothetical protein
VTFLLLVAGNATVASMISLVRSTIREWIYGTRVALSTR